MADHQGNTPHAGMPIMSGEEMHLHDAVAYWEAAQGALADAGLLKAAMGMEPDESRKIVDINPNELPVLPPEHPQYYRQLETMLRIKTQNKSNRRQRYAIVMKQRTEVYTIDALLIGRAEDDKRQTTRMRHARSRSACAQPPSARCTAS